MAPTKRVGFSWKRNYLVSLQQQQNKGSMEQRLVNLTCPKHCGKAAQM